MLRLTNRSSFEVTRILNQAEVWNLLPYDSFIRYGLQHPQHQWFGEMLDGKLIRLIYIHRQLVHLISRDVPPLDSSIYRMLQRQKNRFIIHGQKEIITPFLRGLTQYHTEKMDDAHYVRQVTKDRASTHRKKLHSKRLFLPSAKLSHLSIRVAQQNDFNRILRLYQNSSITNLVDPILIQQLIHHQNVLVAIKTPTSKNSPVKEPKEAETLLGTLMFLKESPRYVLLGGLYVAPEYRKLGIATTLGHRAIKEINSKGRRICFYFNDPSLKRFYGKLALERIGQWVTYVVTSKAQI